MEDIIFTKEQVNHLLETQVKKEIAILGSILFFIGVTIGGMSVILIGYDKVRESQLYSEMIAEQAEKDMTYAISLQEKYKELLDEKN